MNMDPEATQIDDYSMTQMIGESQMDLTTDVAEPINPVIVKPTPPALGVPSDSAMAMGSSSTTTGTTTTGKTNKQSDVTYVKKRKLPFASNDLFGDSTSDEDEKKTKKAKTSSSTLKVTKKPKENKPSNSIHSTALSRALDRGNLPKLPSLAIAPSSPILPSMSKVLNLAETSMGKLTKEEPFLSTPVLATPVLTTKRQSFTTGATVKSNVEIESAKEEVERRVLCDLSMLRESLTHYHKTMVMIDMTKNLHEAFFGKSQSNLSNKAKKEATDGLHQAIEKMMNGWQHR